MEAMKILVIDRDNLAFQLLKSKLEPLGHKLSHEAVKNDAVERMGKGDFDVVFIDPMPLTSPRPVILNIRRNVGNYPYIFLMSENASREDALKAGANDILNKPLDPTIIDEKLKNAERLLKLMAHMGDDSEDFPSAGGVIAKSALNQLFLSTIDRADRYGERSYLLSISLSNYPTIKDLDGAYAADYAAAKLSKYLVLLRRQSDIIGQTRKYEYMLLLQRPVYETEPVEAANRFAESLSGFKDIVTSGKSEVEITVTLTTIPIGATLVQHHIKQAAR
jgi:CheY-like chemotaxis protein